GLAAKLSGLNTRDSLAIGVAMMPRAGVDLVIAVTGLTLGILTMELYFAALVLIYVTSILTPALIKHLLKA
ncbi:MAG: cation:proton antiporter, partial [Desulfurococcales archaeon]|nr:cation:proton antiporter [Desulfurococcales archaeon]